jgi:hypothetical protein
LTKSKRSRIGFKAGVIGCEWYLYRAVWLGFLTIAKAWIFLALSRKTRTSADVRWTWHKSSLSYVFRHRKKFKVGSRNNYRYIFSKMLAAAGQSEESPNISSTGMFRDEGAHGV